MNKSQAIELLGGTIASTAEAIGISYQAVNQWPEDLPPRISDRVQLALIKKKAPGVMEALGFSSAREPAAAAAPTVG